MGSKVVCCWCIRISIYRVRVNSVSNNRILDLSKLEAFADYKLDLTLYQTTKILKLKAIADKNLNIAKLKIFLFDRTENTGKRKKKYW